MSQFDNEAQMSAVLEARLPLLFRARGRPTSAFTEVNVGSVIPDFVVVQQGHAQSGRRVRFTSFDAAILAELLNGRRRAATVARRLWAREDSVSTHLARLVRLGLVREGARAGSFEPVTIPFSATNVIAVEAKVSRWTVALQQALAYRAFSNESYVALPSRLVSSKPHLREAVRRCGIGLLAVTERTVRPVLRAVPRDAITSDYLWVIAQTSGVWLG